MKVTLILALLLTLWPLIAGSQVYAQNSVSSLSSPSALPALNLGQAGAVDLGASQLSPESWFYFLKVIKERAELFLSTTRQQKFDKQLEFSIRRLKETNSLISQHRQDLIPPLLQRYQANLDQAKQLAGNDPVLEIGFGQQISRHLDVLERDYDSISNPQAKTAIRAAIEKIEGQSSQLIGSLGLVYQQQLIHQIALRQALGCQFLARESSSSALNGTERQYLGQKVASCRHEMDTSLRDELLEFEKNHQ